MPTRLFRVACLLLLAALSCGQTTSKPQASPSHKLLVSVKFVNAALLSPRQQEQITKKLREQGAEVENEQRPQDFSGWADEAGERVRAAYQDNGYFKVQVAAELMHVPGNMANRRVAIIVKILDAGQQYRLGDLHWTNPTAFSEQQLRDVVPIHPGEVFSREKIARGLNAARNLYVSHGYINFTCIPNTVIDEAGRSIALEIETDEGGVFHWGDLRVEGMHEPETRELLRAWDSVRGQVYAGDSTKVLDNFFTRYFRPLRRGVAPSDYTTWKIDESTRTVNVYLALVPDPSLLKNIPKSWRRSPTTDKSNP